VSTYVLLSPHRSGAPLRRLIAAGASLLLVVGLLASTVEPVAAVAVQRTWNGTVETYGAASVTAFMDGTGQLGVHLHGVAANTSHGVRIFQGTCARPVKKIVLFASTTSTADGLVDRDNLISARIMGLILAADRTGSGRISMWITAGSTTLCSDLRYPVATRVVFSYKGINLPVIRQNNTAFPYCGVAMYLSMLHQPAERGVTMIYAHGRTGMFLPLVLTSLTNNGAAMLGKKIQVYTSDSKVYEYTVTKVRRRVSYLTGLASTFSITSKQVYLQTSEGPLTTSSKLFVIGTLTSVSDTTYAASHPVAHPYTCR
jgi:hypothetical protein